MTIEEYEALRRELVEANSNLHGLVLREEETRLDAILSELKRELRNDCGGSVPYDLPVLTDARLTGSRLYAFCRRMPKGADLHVHDMALLPAEELIDLLLTRPEFCIDPESYVLSRAEVGAPLPAGVLRFSEALQSGVITREALLQNWTMLGAATSGKPIWDYFECLFSRHSVLSDDTEFAEAYYDRAFRYCCRNGIQHVEIHVMLTGDMEESEAYLRAVRAAYYRVKQDEPQLTVRMIGAGMKADSDRLETSRRCFLNTTYGQELVKDESDPAHPQDFVIGFDLVNEEDGNRTLHDFAPMLLKVKERYPALRFYIHGGESLSADNENLIDAYLLGVSRVGHGLNLYRYPDLHARYVKAEICLEVCPISNQVLGYARDLRTHPATEYLRTGAAIALCSDDPAYMERSTLTDDFFAAVVAWDLSLTDLKQLAINSLQYSGLDPVTKTEALKAFDRAWRSFVRTVLAENGGEARS